MGTAYVIGPGLDRVDVEPPYDPADLRGVLSTAVAVVSDDPALIGYVKVTARPGGGWDLAAVADPGGDVEAFARWAARILLQVFDIGPDRVGLYRSESEPGAWFAHCRLVDGPDMSWLDGVLDA